VLYAFNSKALDITRVRTQITGMRRVSIGILLIFTSCVLRHDEMSPLVTAARDGDVRTIRLLCERGADPDQPSGGNDWTPLVHAIHKNQPGSVAALLEAGASVDRATPSGMTPLMMAAGYGYADIVKVLLAHRANPRVRDAEGGAAVDYALTGMTDIDDFTWLRCQNETAHLLARVSPPPTASARRWSHMKHCI
jgi:ankyrin repeat protein